MKRHYQSISSLRFKPLMVGLIFMVMLSGCAGQMIVIPWQGKTIEIVPRQQVAAVQEVMLSPSLTPFQPVGADGLTDLTNVANQQLNYVTATAGISPTQASETPVDPTATLSQTVTLSGTSQTGTLTQTQNGSQTITPSVTMTNTGTLVLSSATLAHTAIPSRTPSKTQVPVSFTQTLTRTAVPATRTVTLLAGNTSTNTLAPVNSSTFTVAANTRTNTPVPPLPSGCVYTANTGYESTLINNKRSAEGLTPYGVNGLLTNAARGHSQDMACNNYFNHTGLDGSTSASRVAAAGYSYSWVGENIYGGNGGYNSAQSAFTWWVNSEPHLANMMNTNYTEIGIGYIFCADSTYGGYFTANFARP